MTKLTEGAGRKTKIYYLNRNQAMLLITYLDNTKPVREFKQLLIQRFDEMEKELSKRQLERATEKQRGKMLNEVVKNWENAPKFAYPNIRKLLTKAVTGINFKGLKKVRDPDCITVTLLDLLTSEELTEYQCLESLVISLIGLNADYKTIKATVNNIKQPMEV